MKGKLQIKGTHAIVEQILREAPVTRESDNLLYFRVVETLDKSMLNKPFGYALVMLAESELPSFETVRRTRQKIQEKNPELRATDETREHRKELQYDFYDYAKDRY